METRGNYILIGLFTILGLVAGVIFALAFARVEFDRQFAYYDIRFTSVSGLGEASDVRFAGLPVGQVVDISLSPELDGRIAVRIEVDANTPVRTNSVATVESQGVTGVGFVAISAGSEEGELAMASAGEIGVISSGRSVIQSLSEDAPALVAETLQLVRDMGDLFSGDNRDRIEQIIINSEDASASFAQTLQDFSEVSGSVEDFVTQIDRFNAVLQTIAADFDTALITADEAIAAWGAVADDAEAFLTTGTATLETADGAIARAERYVDEELVAATEELNQTIASLRAELTALSTDARGMVATFAETGTLANARLTEVSGTITALDGLINNTNVAVSSVNTAASDFSSLITGDGQVLVDETRAVIATTQIAVDQILVAARDDLPRILANVTEASAQIEGLADDIRADISGASGQLDVLLTNANAALTEASTVFGVADRTLDAINGALATGEDTLTAATSAFNAAEGAIAGELGDFIARMSNTLDGLDVAVAQVSEDLPGISSSLSDASQAAEDAFEGIAAAVAAASPAVREFAAAGLPEYAQFARDARALTASLDRLIRQIERDPGRFFLGSNTPEFRR